MEKISWWRINFGEEEVRKLAESVADEHIGQGPVTSEFEKKLAADLDVPYALATTSGSVALLLALMASGVGRDDEVIVPDRTWIATAHAAVMLGAKVVLVDVLEDIPTMDVSQIERNITPRTKAIMPVHLNGRDTGMEVVNEIASNHGLSVIEDAAQAMYSRNAQGFLGTQSSMGCYSLAVSKIISSGQGGVVVTRSDETYEQLKLLHNHGVVDNFTDTWNQMGFNFKFTDLLASFGLVQLGRAQSRITHVKEIYARYASAIDEMELDFLKLIPVNVTNGELPVYVEVLCSQREHLTAFLASLEIQVRPLPPSLHTSNYLGNPEEFPNSDKFSREGLFLPCGPDQPLENVNRVLAALCDYRDQQRHR